LPHPQHPLSFLRHYRRIITNLPQIPIRILKIARIPTPKRLLRRLRGPRPRLLTPSPPHTPTASSQTASKNSSENSSANDTPPSPPPHRSYIPPASTIPQPSSVWSASPAHSA